MDIYNVHLSLRELLVRASTQLPSDIEAALERALDSEEPGSVAGETLSIILKSAAISRRTHTPLCQDTGALFAVIEARPDADVSAILAAIPEALRELTAEGLLRQNCVDPLTESNTGDNTGAHVPQIHFHPSDSPPRITVMLKGGGSENVSTQYSLPHEGLRAGRDLEGVRRCLLDALWLAQGRGCAPGILGVCIGGDRASGYLVAKRQLLRRLDEPNPEARLAELETQVLEQANTLGIGPMGLGGKTTLLGVRIGCAGRHPACYYVTLSYSCWATRRYGIELTAGGEIARWL